MPRILVVGIAVADAVARPVDAFPSPGGLRFFDELRLTTGGCAVNCSIALSRLGAGVDIVARVGRDPLGDLVRAELEGAGVRTDHVTRDDVRSTSFSFVAVNAAGERSFLHTTGANSRLSPADVPPGLLAAAPILFITGAMLMDSLDGTPAASMLEHARARGVRTALDTVYVENAPPDEWQRRVLPALPHLDYFVPSEAEARALSGDPDPSKAARDFQLAGARNVVIKLGSRGVFCLDRSGRETLVPSFPVPAVVDATGAGDCWAAGFLAGLLEGRDVPDAAVLGNAVAAVSVQSAGATTGITGMHQVTALMRAAGRSPRP